MLAVLVVAASVAFLTGAAVVGHAATTELAAVATDFESPASVIAHDDLDAARAAAGDGDVVLPLADATRSDGKAVTVVGVPPGAGSFAAELGVIAGLLVAFLVASGFGRVGVGLLAVLLLFSFGVLQVVCICTVPVEASHLATIQRKPWYFGAGLAPTLILATVTLRSRLAWTAADGRNTF